MKRSFMGVKCVHLLSLQFKAVQAVFTVLGEHKIPISFSDLLGSALLRTSASLLDPLILASK